MGVRSWLPSNPFPLVSFPERILQLGWLMDCGSVECHTSLIRGHGKSFSCPSALVPFSRVSLTLPPPFIAGRPPSINRSCHPPLGHHGRALCLLSLSLGSPGRVVTSSAQRRRLSIFINHVFFIHHIEMTKTRIHKDIDRVIPTKKTKLHGKWDHQSSEMNMLLTNSVTRSSCNKEQSSSVKNKL